MLQNYLKIALRNLSKNKVYTLVNLFGLSFGLACTLLISIWVWDEFRHDSFHEKGENIYQIFGELGKSDESVIYPYAPSSLAEPIKDRLPEVENITRAFPANVVFAKGDNKFSEAGIYADSDLLSIFTFPLKEGKIEGILSEPNSVVITASLASKYFPNESALGKTIEIVQSEKLNYKITGVIEDVPNYSSIQFDFIMPYDDFEANYRPWWSKSNPNSFNNFNVTTYVKLVNDADSQIFNKKLDTFIADYTREATSNSLFAYSFKEVYLHNDFSEGRMPTGKIETVKLFIVIAAVIFLIACFNFINLSTAIAGKRAKEVGLRKVVGANKRQIIFQFLIESILISITSMVIAVTVVEMAMPIFNYVTQKQINVPIQTPLFIGIISSVALSTGIIAGVYPALLISTFSPSETLKNRSAAMAGLSGLRKGLVVVQFTLSIILISYTLIVYNQVEFIQNKDLGIRKDNIIHHYLHGIKDKKEAYQKALLDLPGVQSVSFTEHNPLNTSNGNKGVDWKGKPEDSEITFNVMQVGENFTETFNLKLLEGREFPDSSNPEGERYFIINEAAAKAMMIENPVGMKMNVWGRDGEVVGLVNNFHHQSLEKAIEPMVIIYNPEEVWRAFISVKTDNTSNVLSQIQSTYSQYEPNYAFDFFFVKDDYDKAYGDVITVQKLSYLFSIAAILISCLGLFGLSAFMAEQRLKEIGIRKVLGASELKLLQLFSLDFIKLVILSFIIATPIIWMYANQWLSSYAYHIDLTINPLLISGVMAIAISLITVGYNTLKAAKTNPVDVLKEE